ncbi:hypothetical protein GS415_03390 [Rhodococcus hoagii]|nr:hypothetical protein [Prescottella equi]
MILLAAIGAIGFLIVTWFAVSNLRARRAERRETRSPRARLGDRPGRVQGRPRRLQRLPARPLRMAPTAHPRRRRRAADGRVPRSTRPHPGARPRHRPRRPKPNRPVPHRGPRTPGSLGQGDENARRIGTSIYERSSRNKLRKAAYALRTALDTSATAAERQAATETVKKLTDGLVKAPERVLSAVTAAIDTARRKELPVGLNQ